MKDKLRGIFRIVIILVGLAILVYPSLSEYLFEKNSSRAMANFDDSVERMREEQRAELLKEARMYNSKLLSTTGYDKPLTDEAGNPITMDSYWELLNIGNSEMMGYISIPCMNVTIPIYHGTSEEVLQVGVGHIQNTSLPVGGASTHAALSGHRGLPSRALFTDLDQLKIGDVFYIKTLDQTLCYTVDQILTVLPGETEHLAVVPQEDYVTLVTCTPYGVNSHRLLVRGTRTPYTSKDGKIPLAASEEISGWMRMPMQYRHLLIGLGVLAIMIILRLLISYMIRMREKRRGS